MLIGQGVPAATPGPPASRPTLALRRAPPWAAPTPGRSAHAHPEGPSPTCRPEAPRASACRRPCPGVAAGALLSRAGGRPTRLLAAPPPHPCSPRPVLSSQAVGEVRGGNHTHFPWAAAWQAPRGISATPGAPLCRPRPFRPRGCGPGQRAPLPDSSDVRAAAGGAGSRALRRGLPWAQHGADPPASGIRASSLGGAAALELAPRGKAWSSRLRSAPRGGLRAGGALAGVPAPRRTQRPAPRAPHPARPGPRAPPGRRQAAPARPGLCSREKARHHRPPQPLLPFLRVAGARALPGPRSPPPRG